MKVLIQYLAVAAAGSLGAVTRLAVGSACARAFGTAFPAGTMLINLTGSFVLGWFMTVATRRADVSDTLRLAVAVGFVGAYTTFSTLAYDSSTMLTRGEFAKATLNLAGSVALGLLAVRLGVYVGSR